MIMNVKLTVTPTDDESVSMKMSEYKHACAYEFDCESK